MILRMCLICKRGRSTHARVNYHPRCAGRGFICGDCAKDAANGNVLTQAGAQRARYAGHLQPGKP
jgi:hypothetical protein